MEDLKKKILNCFKEVIKIEENISTEKIIYNEYPGWDSVAHMAIIAELESNFDCMMDMEDVLDLSSFEKAYEIMQKYL
ncbi:MAG: acyl carrier protein [Candidatus Marinimicrobia bacterium]|nr:acyl carrier protein [Candidatus Neomarinimicrobiota bacterium]|tara:strand:+ start:1072 stop:1305 length:234 start_codon:yes stop_codon:yes gene_type:complete